jgi:formate transporter
MKPEKELRRNSATSIINDDTHDGGLALFSEMVRVRQEAVETTARLEATLEKISKVATTDDHSPAAIAEKAEAAGVTKGMRNILSTALLGILAGVFIGLGAVFCTLVTTGIDIGFGLTKLLGGLVFCLGLILVVVAGAELFTGNSLLTMSFISGRTSLARLAKNWGIVYFANLAGALALVGLMFYTNQWAFSGYGVGANALLTANAKVNLGFGEALVRGILCNFLVCLAVWLCFSARTVTGKIFAIIFPITAFVACGFEHSIANMYFIPMGILMTGQPAVLGAAGVTSEAVANLTWAGFVGNLVPVTIGNVIGGGIFVGATYWLAYLRQERAIEMVSSRPWLGAIFPNLRQPKTEEATSLTVTVRAQIEELIRLKEQEPLALDRGGRVLLGVLSKAANDTDFLAKLSENSTEALKQFDLTSEEKAALASGDIRWIESKLGKLEEPLRTWLNARLSQEKW